MIEKKLDLFADICRLMADATQPQKTLETIVMLVAGRLKIDVCSVYLFDEKKEQLVLRATYGLNPASVGNIRMSPDEGLTGLVAQENEWVFEKKPWRHPRYKHFENSGEEAYGAFLGLPLVYHQQSLGVIVFQTRDEEVIQQSDIPVFISIASQIAATVAYTGLLENLEKERSQRENLEKKLNVTPGDPQPIQKSKKNILRGIPVSPGIAEGQAHYLPAAISFDQVACLMGSDVKSEIKRMEIALGHTRDEIKTLIDGISHLPAEDAAIFESHLMFIKDAGFRKRLFDQIKNGFCAEYALKLVIEKLMAQFLEIQDPYLRERAADIEDIGKHILQNLLGAYKRPSGNLDQPTILVAADISVTDLISLNEPQLKGIALSRGGKTSHTSILAKSLEIPMVIGLSEILETVKENDALILDGQSGLLFKEPTDAILSEYKRLRAEKEKDIHQLAQLRDLKAVTLDGREVFLDANIGLLSDLQLVEKYGANQIGLYRTEFPFLTRKEFPTEDEQTDLYTRILQGANGRCVTIRTLDVGGDKFLSYLDNPKELNPYLGWRSIRVSLELDDIFRTQLRAILRASAHGPVKLLFPMICSIKEVHKIILILEEEKNALASMGIPFDAGIPVGTMVEVPAAVKILNHILDRFNFVSIGTNDLIQYTLAVDRNNPKVASLYNPLHPAVLSTISEIIYTCAKRRKEVSICGEAAANPKCAFLFTAMGVDRLSMSPSAIPIVKNLIRRMNRKHAESILSKVMEMGDEDQISLYLDDVLDAVDSEEKTKAGGQSAI